MTRRKKYAIMMKTRCAKGENAVENLIPRWYRELELFRGVKPLLVLEGCVMDQVRVPVTGSVAEDTLLPLSAFLNAYLSDAGYEQVVFYSNLVGLMNPYAPEMLDMASRIHLDKEDVWPLRKCFNTFTDGSFPKVHMTITLKNGTILKGEMQFPKGHPRNPFDWADCENTFRIGAGPPRPNGGQQL